MTPSAARVPVAALLSLALSGCMTHDLGTDWRMGVATEHNIAQQAVRETDEVNLEGVEGGAGGRGGAPVKALREEGAKALRTEETGG